ncbi:MAG: hypothetical protein SW833_20780, partial [Cyanobacteriota bacterium]|nr:hypothetical protein [Cyanobacteriota bacterium]
PQAAAPAPPPSKPNPRTLAPAPTAAPAPPPPSAPQVEASSPESETIPSLSNYSLYGLIVNSDGSSAALFKVNGTTQRIREGEAIGDSGWTLFSVSNQSAVVRRNGTVREIYAGQEF